MKRIHLVIACILSVFGFACNTPNSPTDDDNTFKSVTVEEFAKCLEGKNVVILDVRTPTEYAAGHIKNAININVEAPDFEENAVAKLPIKKTIAVYCRSGRRSKTAAEILCTKGYKVIELDKGINSWTSAGMPIVE